MRLYSSSEAKYLIITAQPWWGFDADYFTSYQRDLPLADCDECHKESQVFFFETAVANVNILLTEMRYHLASFFLYSCIPKTPQRPTIRKDFMFP